MTSEKEQIKIFDAIEEGKVIQYCYGSEYSGWTKWVDIPNETLSNKLAKYLYTYTHRFRVKPLTKLVPFNNVREFIDAYNKHGNAVLNIGDNGHIFTLSRTSYNTVTFSDGNGAYSLSAILKLFVFYDGTPCGIEITE